MFDVDFFEVVVIFGVALIVLGPKKLPGLVRSVGRWVGKARSMARQFREQLENEVQIEELNKLTQSRTSEPSPPKPAAPPGATSEQPAPPEPAPAQDNAVAGSGYPYGTPSSAETAVPDPGAPAPTDDTYSHAHAAGGKPAPYHPEAPWLNEPEGGAFPDPDAPEVDAGSGTGKPGGPAAA